MRNTLILLSMLVILCIPIQAQEQFVQVPDVTGMNVPQAVSILNQAGLNVGQQVPVDQTEGITPNTVVSQNLESDNLVPYGTAIDLSVALPNNARLIYDDNDITMLNMTDAYMNTPNLSFRAMDGNGASYNISQLGGGLDANDCFQFWAISRGNPKDVDGCSSTNWRTSTNPDFHFWTHTSGASRFAIVENGIQRAVCPTAGANTQNAPLSCDFYLAGGGAGNEVTDFLYFAYTEDALAIINISEDKWMPTNQTQVYNYNPRLAVQGVGGVLGDPEVLREDFRVGLGDVTLLAPNQCIVYTIEGRDVNAPPENCDVVAQRALSRDVVVWVADFEVESAQEDQIQTCPAATEGRLTRCIVGR